MISPDYEYYTSIYGGELTQDEFNLYLKKAQRKIDNIVNGALSKTTGDEDEQFVTDVKDLTCSVLDKLSILEQSSGSDAEMIGLSSIKVGSVSKTFSTGKNTSSIASTKSGMLREDILEYCGKYGWGCRWV